jgi:hypothetical protein
MDTHTHTHTKVPGAVLTVDSSTPSSSAEPFGLPTKMASDEACRGWDHRDAVPTEAFVQRFVFTTPTELASAAKLRP